MRPGTVVVISLTALVAACNGSPAPSPLSGLGSAGGGSGSGAVVETTSPRRAAIDMAPSVKRVTLDEAHVVLPTPLAFELVDPGKGTRAPLRYAFARGTVDYPVETRLKSRHLENGAWSPIVEQPPFRDGFAIAAGDRPGLLAIRALPADIGGTKTPEAEQYMATWTALLGNRRMTATVDDRGQLSALELSDDLQHTKGPAARDEAMQRLLGMVVPLPEQPVGVGASWRVTTALRQGTAIVKQTATYTLTARSATEWKIHVKLRRDAEPQPVDAGALPQGTLVELVAIFRVLEGDVTVMPTRPLGVAKLALESRVHAKITPPHEVPIEQLLEDTGELEMSATPEPAP